MVKRMGQSKNSMNNRNLLSRFLWLLILGSPLLLGPCEDVELKVLSSFIPCAMADASDQRQTEGGRFEMEEVVVTATMIEEPIREIPKNVTVITSEDIAQASSNNVVDLLAREANINLLSFFGTDKRSSVDIRGFGQTGVSNVVVMVDGFRLNSPDLAGPDFSSVPLDQIERIEIVRGGGSVLYGDGAVGGVINIITKKGPKKSEARILTSYGSYDAFEGATSLGGQFQGLRANLDASYYDSDGYRDNGGLRKRDGSAKLSYDVNDRLSLSWGASYHEDKQGFPGGVPLEDVDSKGKRKESSSPNDFGETTDKRVSAAMEAQAGPLGVLRFNSGYRWRDNDFIIGYTPLLSKGEQTDTIDEDTWSFNLVLTKPYEFLGRKHKLLLGTDYYQTDYVTERIGQRTKKDSDINDLGPYVMNEWRLLKPLTFTLGYRYSIYDGTIRTSRLVRSGGDVKWERSGKSDEKWKNQAFETGIVYELASAATLFASYASSFRTPNVDELALSEGDLKPQEGKHIDVGLRGFVGDLLEFSLTLFQIDIKDEIFFDSINQVNRNFDDDTRRRGIETEVKCYPIDILYLWANYTYMQAKFQEQDTDVPLVPRHKASFGMEWTIVQPLRLALTGTWVGSRFDGNDETNEEFKKLDGYKVFDAKLTYTRGPLRVFGGVNNIFDELYSTLAFSEIYYPMPTRNYYVGSFVWAWESCSVCCCSSQYF
jgi:iron complex outermembrane receptor protein